MTSGTTDPTFAHRELPGTAVRYYPLDAIRDAGLGDPTLLPVTLKILLESIVRRTAQGLARADDVRALVRWPDPPDAGA